MRLLLTSTFPVLLSFSWFLHCIASKVHHNHGGEHHHEFQPDCNIHIRKHGRETPRDLILSKATDEWLYPTEDEIKKYYDIGKAECEAFLSQPSNVNEYLSYQHANYYTRTDQAPASGQKLCRGRGSFYELSGMIAWVFGPYKLCPTYSKCWFGILSCGNFKSDFVRDTTHGEIESWLNVNLENIYHIPKIELPKNLIWTIRSLAFHTRIVGTELISPDLRYYPLKTTTGKEDIIIGQYFITIPDDNYQLEVRHYEFYPTLVYDWSSNPDQEKKFYDYGISEGAIMFLGGNEGRCRPWTHCTTTNVCCGCDEKTFIVHSPSSIHVPENPGTCIKAFMHREVPICTSENSPKRTNGGGGGGKHENNNFGTPPGRWIHSTSKKLSPNCQENAAEYPAYSLFDLQYITDPQAEAIQKANQAATLQRQQTLARDHQLTRAAINSPNAHRGGIGGHRRQLSESEASSSSSSSSSTSFLHASGNPCIVSKEKEEFDSEYWFYAPYHCKYHFYTRHELNQCFQYHSITHLQFQGDSISRELFSVVTRYMGIKSATETELKKLTNEMKQHNIKFFAPSENNGIQSGNHLLLSEGYSWEYNPAVMKLVDEPPLPNILVMNNALAHRVVPSYHLGQVINRTESEISFWKDHFKAQLPAPTFRIFQNAKELHGKRDNPFFGNVFRKDSTLLRDYYIDEFQFMELDEFLLSMAKYDNYTTSSDGWHTMGNVRQMETIVLMNMICNDWYVKEYLKSPEKK